MTQSRPTLVLLLSAGFHGNHLPIGQVVLWQRGYRQRDTVSQRLSRVKLSAVLDLLKAILLKFIIHDREGHVNNLTIRAHAAVARKVFLDTFPQVQDNVWT